MISDQEHSNVDGLSIGVVARLTGINAETLRVWERRYGLTRPARAGARGNRRYSQEDVRRLGAIKALVDAGHPVSSIAALSMAQLEARLRGEAQLGRAPESVRTGPIRVITLGVAMAELVRQAPSDLELVASYTDLAAFERRTGSLQADVGLLEVPSLHSDALPRVLRLAVGGPPSRWVLVYGFAAGATISSLEQSGFTCLSQPVSLADVRRACALSVGRAMDTSSDFAPVTEAIPARRFDAVQLIRIAREAPTVQCECPRHLVSLVTSLVAFEAYSRDCASANARDRALHQMLHAATAQARARLERALAELIEAEGIPLG